MDNLLESALGTQFDEVDYPVKIRRDFLSLYPNFEIGSHWHDDVEFLVILRGNMQCSVNGEIVELHPDEGLFVNARQVHDAQSVEKRECEYVMVRFHPVLLCATRSIENRYVLPVIENASCPYQVLSPEIEWQRNILDAVLRVYYMRHETTLELGAQGQFFAIWEHLFRHLGSAPAKTREVSPQLTQLKSMISFIADNYHGKITLDDICASGNMGKTSCCQVFQKYLNQTPNMYLTMFRLRKGAERLAQTDMPIVDIAYEVGFSGASYFAEAFKKNVGEMPSEFRKRHRRVGEERK
ncbi:MAG: helix-turn-helix transcriptional regulator [Clostridiales bacterium]|nr:helix-turn-helix transcriptional regulator [Clostridiales bacterium]